MSMADKVTFRAIDARSAYAMHWISDTLITCFKISLFSKLMKYFLHLGRYFIEYTFYLLRLNFYYNIKINNINP